MEEGQHWDFGSSLHISPGKPRFTVVRNPFGWYASFWAFRDKLGWGGDLVLGADCVSDTFVGFLEKALIKHPRFLTELFARYTLPGVMVMQTRSLGNHLIDVLEKLREPFDEEKLLSVPPANIMARLPEYKAKCHYTPELAMRVAELERAVFVKYGYDLSEGWL